MAESFSNSGYGQEERYSTHILAHTGQSTLLSHRCALARSAYALTYTPSTRPTPTNANVAADLRQYATFSSSAGIGWRNDTRCGQASDHA